CVSRLFFVFAGSSTACVYALSLHDALPIFERLLLVLDLRRALLELGHLLFELRLLVGPGLFEPAGELADLLADLVLLGGQRLSSDRKSTRLNSSHVKISYAVFCLKKKRMLR